MHAFEVQNPRFVAGMSGTELLEYALEQCKEDRQVPNLPRMNTSPDYWAGYSLPYFQTHTSCTYDRLYEQGVKNINQAASDTVRRLSVALRCRMEDVLEIGM